MLLLLLPQCILATVMIYFFQQKNAKQQQRILQVRNTNTPTADDGFNHPQRSSDSYGDDEPNEEDNRAAHELDSATSSDSESDVAKHERTSLALQYMSNLQHIQNMMGDVSDAHDQLRPLFRHLDWSDETEAVLIVQGCMAAFVGMSVAMWFIPWRLVFLVGGVAGMLANSPWGKVVMRELGPLAQEVAMYGRTALANRNK